MWQWDDLTVGSDGAPPVAQPARLASHVVEWEGTQHVFYRTGDGRIVELWWAGGQAVQWGYLSDEGAPQAVGDLASHVMDADHTQHVFYRSRENQIIELWWSGSVAAQRNPLTERSAAPRAAGDPASHVVVSDGTQHVFYRAVEAAVENEIIEVWWRPGEQPQAVRLSDRSKGPRAAGDPVSHVFTDDFTQHVFYPSVEGNLTELRWFGLEPPARDLTGGLSASDAPASGAAAHFFAVHHMGHVFYAGTDSHLRRFGIRGNEEPGLEDLQISSGGSPLVVGGPTSHVFNSEGTQHVFYIADDHVIELWSRD